MNRKGDFQTNNFKQVNKMFVNHICLVAVSKL